MLPLACPARARLLVLVLGTATMLMLTAGPAAAFPDTEGTGYQEAVEALEAAGVAHGYADGRFAPHVALRRAEAAAFLERALDLPATAEHDFDDVAGGGEHEQAIATLAEAGIILGTTSDTFQPWQPARRDHGASFVARAFSPDASSEQPFDDVPAAHADDVAALVAAGWVNGCEHGRFCAAEPLTRGQMALVLARAMGMIDPVEVPAAPVALDDGALEPVAPEPQPVAPEPEVVDTFTGMASWYGEAFRGRPTASGEAFDPDALTAAHRELAFGTRVRVTHVASGRDVTVRINDRGPFAGDRIIDLSRAAAEEIGMVSEGVAQVRVQVLR